MQSIEFEKTKHKIKVMQAYVEGKKIEIFFRNEWIDMTHEPNWDWVNYDYRIAPPQRPILDWSQVSKDFNVLTVFNGAATLSSRNVAVPATAFSSFDMNGCVDNCMIPRPKE